MIDLFTLALTHGLMALAAFFLLTRDELDSEEDKASGKSPKPDQSADEG